MPEAANLPARTPLTAAERMRRYRKQQRRGERTVRVVLGVEEIEALIRKRYLDQKLRNDPDEVQLAAGAYLSNSLLDIL